MPPWAGGAQLQAKAQPFCLAHGLHSSKKFFPWLGCTNNAAAPAIAWLHLSGGCGASARMVAAPWDAPDFGKPQQLLGLAAPAAHYVQLFLGLRK